jgi:hypothetical protein
VGLQGLECYKCSLLNELPNIVGLQELYCENCPLITEIPNIAGLEELRCYSCPLLTEIPNIAGLQILICYKCKWLNIDNVRFNDQLNKLKVIQRRYRKRQYIRKFNCRMALVKILVPDLVNEVMKFM